MEKNVHKENLYRVNDCDYIDEEYIQAIHIDPETKTMSVLYYGVAIPITESYAQRRICEAYLRKTQLTSAVKILGF